MSQTKAQAAADEPSGIVRKLYAAQKAGTPIFNQTSNRATLDQVFRKDLADLRGSDASGA